MRAVAVASVIAAAALLALRAYLVYPDLPVTLASHFDGSGEPDGWSPKSEFMTVMGGVVAMLAGFGLGIPLLVGVIPTRWFNLPNRDYWLAPERALETRAAMQVYLGWFMTATLGLVGWILELTYRANLAPAAGGEVRLSNHAWTALAAFAVFTIAWLVLFMRRFRR